MIQLTSATVARRDWRASEVCEDSLCLTADLRSAPKLTSFVSLREIVGGASVCTTALDLAIKYVKVTIKITNIYRNVFFVKLYVLILMLL